MLPSLSDLNNAKRYKYSLIACHNGTIIKFTVADNADILRADMILDIMQPHFNNKEDLSISLSELKSCGVIMEVIR